MLGSSKINFYAEITSCQLTSQLKGYTRTEWQFHVSCLHIPTHPLLIHCPQKNYQDLLHKPQLTPKKYSLHVLPPWNPIASWLCHQPLLLRHLITDRSKQAESYKKEVVKRVIQDKKCTRKLWGLVWNTYAGNMATNRSKQTNSATRKWWRHTIVTTGLHPAERKKKYEWIQIRCVEQKSNERCENVEDEHMKV